jgi:thiamine-phosphate pyrophosphorylase
MRNATGDVGRTVQVHAEYRREAIASVAAASLNRVQQAMRCLEEYGKQLDDRIARECEQIRYECYELERAVMLTQSSRERLANARLYVLADGAEDLEQFSQRVEQLVKAGVHIIQLRDKQLSDRELLTRATILREMTRESSTQMIINDRPDLACLAHADGVHLGQEEITVSQARRIVGPSMLVGVSTHSLQQAQQAALDGANYLGAGPTFPSTTKRFESHTGIAFLTEVADEISLPCFAIGGIDLENLSRVLNTGMTRVAVSAAVWRAEHVQDAAQAFLTQLRPVPADDSGREVGSTQ